MPIPVSHTSIARHFPAFSPLRNRSVPGAGRPNVTLTVPRSVNLIALDIRFLITCSTRFRSLTISAGAPSCIIISRLRLFSATMCWKAARTPSPRSLTLTVCIRNSIFPASILDKSKISLIRFSRSLPPLYMIFMASTCSEVRLSSLFCASPCARSSRLLSGVRNS